VKVKAGGQEPLRLRVLPLLRSQGRATLAPQQLLLRSWRIAPNAGRVSGRSGGTAAYLKFHALRDNLNGRRRASRNPGQESPSDILILLAGRMWDTPRRCPSERRKSRHKRPRSCVHNAVRKFAYRQDLCDAGPGSTRAAARRRWLTWAPTIRSASERRPLPAPPGRAGTRRPGAWSAHPAQGGCGTCRP